MSENITAPIIHQMAPTNNGDWVVSLLGNARSVRITVPVVDDFFTKSRQNPVFKSFSGRLTFSPSFEGIDYVPYGSWQMSAEKLLGKGRFLRFDILSPKLNTPKIIRFGFWSKNNASPGELQVFVTRVNKRLSLRMKNNPIFAPN